jgi:lipoprotein-anchoring transpeptidase ErfK/SrfK
MKRVLVCTLLALAGLAVAAPSASPPPQAIGAGVRVGHARVGGLTAEPARARIVAAFERPVRFVFHSRAWSAEPAALGARAAVSAAVMRALQAPASSRVPLHVTVNRKRLDRYVAGLDRKLSRPAVDAQAVGVDGNLRPIITEPRAGQRVDRALMGTRIVHALRAGDRRPVSLVVQDVEPSVTRDNIGPIIVIRRDSHRLLLYNGATLWQTFPIATGQSQYPTPTGDWQIVDMQVNPWWRPPDSPWAQGAKPIPPGPGNPLGTRWMGLSAPGVGIHATPDAASVGYSASHGCIRMYQANAEWLFQHVHVGTPVFIRAA